MRTTPLLLLSFLALTGICLPACNGVLSANPSPNQSPNPDLVEVDRLRNLPSIAFFSLGVGNSLYVESNKPQIFLITNQDQLSTLASSYSDIVSSATFSFETTSELILVDKTRPSPAYRIEVLSIEDSTDSLLVNAVTWKPRSGYPVQPVLETPYTAVGIAKTLKKPVMGTLIEAEPQ